jgi:hypothetical protein
MPHTVHLVSHMYPPPGCGSGTRILKISNSKIPHRLIKILCLPVIDGLYVYQISFGLASGQVLRCSQGTLLPLSVNPRYRICGRLCNARFNLISGKHFDLEKGFCI